MTKDEEIALLREYAWLLEGAEARLIRFAAVHGYVTVTPAELAQRGQEIREALGYRLKDGGTIELL